MVKTFNLTELRLAAFVMASLLCCSGCDGGDEEAKRFAQGLRGARVTVYPAVVRSSGGIAHDAAAAEVIAEALKQAGAREARVVEEEITLSSKTSFNQGAMFQASEKAFGEYVKSHSSGAEYAAVAEYLMGSNGIVGGIHFYVVNAGGTRAYGTLMNSHHAEYKAVQPPSIAKATTALIARLSKQLHS